VEWALLAAFVVLAALVAAGVGVQSVDDDLLRSLPWSDAPDASHRLAHLSYLLVLYGSPELSIAVTLAGAGAWSWWRRDLVPVRRIVPPVLIGSLAILALKALLRRTGPPTADPVTFAGYFPSGHTATALLCAGAVALAVAEQRPRLRVPLLVATGVWTTLIAAALLYHRFHWTSDVLGSVLLCLLVLRIAARDGRDRRNGRNQVRPGRRPRGSSPVGAS
jgi:undecaprenyl-diphosphatase